MNPQLPGQGQPTIPPQILQALQGAGMGGAGRIAPQMGQAMGAGAMGQAAGSALAGAFTPAHDRIYNGLRNALMQLVQAGVPGMDAVLNALNKSHVDQVKGQGKQSPKMPQGQMPSFSQGQAPTTLPSFSGGQMPQTVMPR